VGAGSVFPLTFIVAAAELFVLCLLLGAYLVFRVSYPEVHRAALRNPHWLWGTAQAVVVSLAAASAWAATRSAGRRPRSTVMVLAATVAIQGLVALGLKAMEWARYGGPQVVTLVPASPVAATPPARAAFSSKADARQGAKVVAATCSACHGPAGEGVAGVAPGLRDIVFVAAASDADVAAIIRNGRAAGDPANKTGKAMPARGGNPFLSDADVSNIVAFLREHGGATPAAPQQTTQPAAVATPRWIVPPPPRGPQGLSNQFIASQAPAALPAAIQTLLPTDAESAFAPVAALLGALQGIHLLVGIGAAVVLLWQAYALPGWSAMPLAGFTRVCWSAAVVLWVVLFPLLYVL
jgi:mono/diheme cytochrome c family protein